MGNADDLQNEWARANRAGRAANRQKMLATLASVGITFPIVVVGYVVILALPVERIPIILFALPWLPALPAGWWDRQKLWPRGAFGR